jgi:hypothetical protein
MGTEGDSKDSNREDTEEEGCRGVAGERYTGEVVDTFVDGVDHGASSGSFSIPASSPR